jgi:hypothetical protein
MATVIMVFHKAQNPLTENDDHTVATVIETYTLIILSQKT